METQEPGPDLERHSLGQGEKDGEFWKRPEEKVEFLFQTEIDTIVFFTEGERKSRVGEGGRGVHGEHLMRIGEKE